MAKATNDTDHEIAAQVGGKWYSVAPGKTVSASARDALSLGEYGLTVLDRDQVIAADDAPVTRGETRHTGGRQHRQDDDRTNPAGASVDVTGDTGSTTGADPAGDGGNQGEDEILKGAELDAALEEAGLAKTGTADEKRERLAAHVAAASS